VVDGKVSERGTGGQFTRTAANAWASDIFRSLSFRSPAEPISPELGGERNLARNNQ